MEPKAGFVITPRAAAELCRLSLRAGQPGLVHLNLLEGSCETWALQLRGFGSPDASPPPPLPAIRNWNASEPELPQDQVSCSAVLPGAPRGLHSRVHLHTQKAEFGSAESGSCAPYLRF